MTVRGAGITGGRLAADAGKGRIAEINVAVDDVFRGEFLSEKKVSESTLTKTSIAILLLLFRQVNKSLQHLKGGLHLLQSHLIATKKVLVGKLLCVPLGHDVRIVKLILQQLQIVHRTADLIHLKANRHRTAGAS